MLNLLYIEEKTTNLWPKLTIFFFLLIFLQLILFFRLLCSFFSENHELLIYVSFLAGMSFSYLSTSSALKNTISIITKKPVKSRKKSDFMMFLYFFKVIHNIVFHMCRKLWNFKSLPQFVDNSWISVDIIFNLSPYRKILC